MKPELKPIPWAFLVIITLLLTLPTAVFSQPKDLGRQIRALFPYTPPLRTGASPLSYCESEGGNPAFENISHVSVVEKPGNLLDITVEIFIANPTGCVSGEPCPAYDDSPEYVNAWIDWDGDQTWEPHERVLDAALTGYENINYSGTMTAKTTVAIPPDAVRPTWLRANLGWSFDPNDPCERFWTWGDVKDQQVLWNLRVQELTSRDDIQIPVFQPPLWQGTYDETGQLLSVLANKPIVAAMKRGTFTLPVQLVSFPADLGADGRTTCQWEVRENGIRRTNFTSQFTGKNGEVTISVPQKIGFYELHLKFTFFNAQNGRIGEQMITLPLWVSYDQPGIPVEQKNWLEKALTWTTGATNPDEIALKMMNGIYAQSGWQYFTFYFNWKKLFTGEESGGNCGVNRTVWLNLLKAMGVGGATPVSQSGRKNKGFMAKAGFASLGNLATKNGNARESFTFSYDRWVFDAHHFGRRENIFYDPTFNVTHEGDDLYFHVDFDIIDKVNGTLIGGRPNDPGSATIYENGKFGANGGHWPAYIYSASGAYPERISPAVRTTGASFTGSFNETTVDGNGDGFFNQLGATVGVEISEGANYLIVAVLRKGDSTITAKPLHFSASAWSEIIGPNTGAYEVSAFFSGEDIFLNGLDGPFDIEMVILDTTGALADIDTFATAAHSFSSFGELPGRLQLFSELAQDTSGDGLFDEILATVQFSISLSGTYALESVLKAAGQTIATAKKVTSLTSGIQQAVLSLPGTDIAAAGEDGPYTLSIQVLDTEGEQTIYQQIQTAAYTAAQFAPPPVRITGASADAGVDVDGNGLFDSLEVTLNLQSSAASSATLRAWLESQNGETIAIAQAAIAAIGANQAVQLRFPGLNINASQVDGPYVLGRAALYDEDGNPIFSVEDFYQTQAYTAAQFEAGGAPLITTTGNYAESTIDVDADGKIDSLVILVEVVPRDSGNVVALARLVDNEDETIRWSSTVAFLQENTAQPLSLKFDGRYIYGGLVDGPYHLRDLQIYHVGDPSQAVEISAPYITQFYPWQDFEPAAVIAGSVTDSVGNPLHNIFLIVENEDFDYTNPAGKYNLVFLQDGNYLVQIADPDSLSLDWSIYVNGEFRHSGDSVSVAATVGEVVTVNFVAPRIITAIDDPHMPDGLPDAFALGQNYPNPFNPGTTIRFALPRKSRVTLKLFDIMGREVATLVDEERPAGEYQVVFEARDLPSGIYLYRMQAGEFVQTRKLVLLR